MRSNSSHVRPEGMSGRGRVALYGARVRLGGAEVDVSNEPTIVGATIAAALSANAFETTVG